MSVHTCSRCGDTVKSDRTPPDGWIISVSWSSPEDAPKVQNDLKRREICPKHREDIEAEHSLSMYHHLSQEALKIGFTLVPVCDSNRQVKMITKAIAEATEERRPVLQAQLEKDLANIQNRLKSLKGGHYA